MAIDPQTYPLPRRKRAVPSAALANLQAQQDPAEIAVPRYRFFSAQILESGNLRRTVSTPVLIGPAMIVAVDFSYGAGGDPPGGSMEIGWAFNSVSENGVAVTTPRPYTVLTERIDPFNMSGATIGTGLLTRPANNPRQRFHMPTRFLVTEANFVFTFSVIDTVALSENTYVTAAILEALPPTLLHQYFQGV